MGARSWLRPWTAAVRICAAADLRDGITFLQSRPVAGEFASIRIGDPVRVRRDRCLLDWAEALVFSCSFNRRGGRMVVRSLPGPGYLRVRAICGVGRDCRSAYSAARPDHGAAEPDRNQC